ncbi:hypothetical protein LXL04_036345 [Taraxacum kok-saghyz]
MLCVGPTGPIMKCNSQFKSPIPDISFLNSSFFPLKIACWSQLFPKSSRPNWELPPPSAAGNHSDLINSARPPVITTIVDFFQDGNFKNEARFPFSTVNVCLRFFLSQTKEMNVAKRMEASDWAGRDMTTEVPSTEIQSYLNLYSYRSPLTMKNIGDDETDVENGRFDKEKERSSKTSKIKVNNQALLSGLAYCLSSCSMILVNKYVLSSYDFNAGISLMLYQNFVSVLIVSSLSILGVISTEPLTWRLIKVWLPVNFIFVGMLITSMFSLRYINVAMVTVLKNFTNVITAVGEMYLFNKHHDNRVWAALFLMIISAVSGGITDLAFNAVGYTWQIVNCFLTASYSLTLRRVMDTAKQVTKSGQLNEFSMVLLNNTLSLPLGLVLIFVFNEVDYLYTTPLLRMPTFWMVMTFSGFLGLAISFTSMWFLHQTGATTYRQIYIFMLLIVIFAMYSLVGSLNKIPLSVAGIVLFHVPTSIENSASILFGLVAGVLFARAKIKDRTQS